MLLSEGNVSIGASTVGWSHGRLKDVQRAKGNLVFAHKVPVPLIVPLARVWRVSLDFSPRVRRVKAPTAEVAEGIPPTSAW